MLALILVELVFSARKGGRRLPPSLSKLTDEPLAYVTTLHLCRALISSAVAKVATYFELCKLFGKKNVATH